jgi:hypothetical protein
MPENIKKGLYPSGIPPLRQSQTMCISYISQERYEGCYYSLPYCNAGFFQEAGNISGLKNPHDPEIKSIRDWHAFGRTNYMSSILSFLAKREPDGRRTPD